MGSPTLTAAVIGNSKYAQRVHIPFLRNHPSIKLEAIAFSRPPRQDENRKLELDGITKVYPDYREMLLELKPTIVVISSAPMPHYEQIRASLEAGAHVLVDKAMVCSKAQAEDVVGLAKSKSLLLGVAVQRRYEDSVLHLREVVRTGQIGKITLVKAFYSRWFPPFENTWRNDPTVGWGGITADLGYHIIDTTLWICDLQPVTVHAEMLPVNLSVEDISCLNIRFANGSVGSIVATYVPPEGIMREEIEIYGANGAVFFQRKKDYDHSKSVTVQHVSREGKTIPVPPYADEADPQGPTRNFVNALLSQEALLATGESSIPTVALIDAAYKSSLLRRVETI